MRQLLSKRAFWGAMAVGLVVLAVLSFRRSDTVFVVVYLGLAVVAALRAFVIRPGN